VSKTQLQLVLTKKTSRYVKQWNETENKKTSVVSKNCKLREISVRQFYCHIFYKCNFMLNSLFYSFIVNVMSPATDIKRSWVKLKRKRERPTLKTGIIYIFSKAFRIDLKCSVRCCLCRRKRILSTVQYYNLLQTNCRW
jgi:hypothetical protein